MRRRGEGRSREEEEGFSKRTDSQDEGCKGRYQRRTKMTRTGAQEKNRGKMHRIAREKPRGATSWGDLMDIRARQRSTNVRQEKIRGGN